MKKQKPYSELAREAEAAVAAIKDPELRLVAFGRVLDDLLATGSSSIEAKESLKQTKTRPTGPKSYVRELTEADFFKEPKTIAQVKAELGNEGHHIAITSLSGPLQELCKEHILRRNKIKTGKNKKTYNYSNY